MGRDRLLVGVNLTEKQRLQEAPNRRDRMYVLHGRPQFEGTQHIAIQLHVALHKGIAEAPFIQRSDCRQRPVVLERDVEATQTKQTGYLASGREGTVRYRSLLWPTKAIVESRFCLPWLLLTPAIIGHYQAIVSRTAALRKRCAAIGNIAVPTLRHRGDDHRWPNQSHCFVQVKLDASFGSPSPL